MGKMSVGPPGCELPRLSLAAFPLELDLVTGHRSRVDPLDGFSTHLPSDRERDGISAYFSAGDGDLPALNGRHGSGRLFASRFETEGLLAGLTVVVRGNSVPNRISDLALRVVTRYETLHARFRGLKDAFASHGLFR